MLELTALVAIGFFIGGILKGATGAGAPLISVPLLAITLDVQTAIAIFALPNLIPNIWQTWRFRAQRPDNRLFLRFACMGLPGAFVGTLFLANLPATWLSLGVAFAVLAYVCFKLFNQNWRLSDSATYKLAAPAGALAGTLQGATGIAAPISISFLNATGIPRQQFVPTISAYFVSVSMAQIPMLLWFGLLTPQWALLGLLSLVPLMAGMPVGNWMVRYISAVQFDRFILLILCVLAIRILAGLWLPL